MQSPNRLGAKKLFNTEGLFRFSPNKPLFEGRSVVKTKPER